MKSLVALAILAFATLIVGCTSAAPGPTASPPATGTPATGTSAPPGEAVTCLPQAVDGNVSTAVVDFNFEPADIAVSAGQTVTWTNNGAAPHTVTLDDGPSCPTERLSAGARHSLTFDQPGDYSFHCAIHPTMTGKVTVQP